jgi:hypothetical protein
MSLLTRLLKLPITFRCLLFLSLFLCKNVAQAQSSAAAIAPVGKFLKDSVKVGEPVQFSLSIKHSIDSQVLFPDSMYDFSPFEYLDRNYFPTRSNDSTSLDSIVYTLATFETEPTQALSLPAFILTGKDSLPVYSNPASVKLVAAVKVVPKEFQLESNADLMPIKKQVNYPYILIGLGILLVLCYLLFLVFGKIIVRYYQLNTLGLRQRRFELAYGKLIRQWEQRRSTETLQKILVSWKAHLEKLDNKPYSAFTSKEIIAVLPNEPIKEKLQRIDAIIYGAGDQIIVPTAHLRALLVVSRNLYNKRKEELRHA